MNLNKLRNEAYSVAKANGWHEEGHSNEHWMPVKGFEGVYMVSNMGRVKSVDRITISKNGKRMPFKETILKPKVGRGGYMYLTLHWGAIKKTAKIHRLVAEAFIPNPLNKPQVNHIDEDKTNNMYSNLEWCTAKENCNHGTHNIRMSMNGRNAPSKSSPVLQFSLQGDLIKRWESLCEIERSLGFLHCTVSDCCYGKKPSMYGFIWCFEKEYSKELISSKVEKYKRIHTSKKVAQYSLDGELIKIWESSKQIFEELGIRDSSISCVCNGKRKHCYKYVWKYV